MLCRATLCSMFEANFHSAQLGLLPDRKINITSAGEVDPNCLPRILPPSRSKPWTGNPASPRHGGPQTTMGRARPTCRCPCACCQAPLCRGPLGSLGAPSSSSQPTSWWHSPLHSGLLQLQQQCRGRAGWPHRRGTAYVLCAQTPCTPFTLASGGIWEASIWKHLEVI